MPKAALSALRACLLLCLVCITAAQEHCESAQVINCAGKEVIAGDTSMAFPSSNFTSSCNGAGSGNTGSKDLWYKWTMSTEGQNLMFNTCQGTEWDTVLDVYTGCGSDQFVTCNDDGCSPKSMVSFPATYGITYYIRVRGYSATSEGYFQLTCEEHGPPPPSSTPSPSPTPASPPSSDLPNFELEVLDAMDGKITLAHTPTNSSMIFQYLIQPSVFRKAAAQPSPNLQPSAVISHSVVFYSRDGPRDYSMSVCSSNVQRICEGTHVGGHHVVTSAQCAGQLTYLLMQQEQTSSFIFADVQGYGEGVQDYGVGADYTIMDVTVHPSWWSTNTSARFNIAVVTLSTTYTNDILATMPPLAMYDGESVEASSCDLAIFASAPPCYLSQTGVSWGSPFTNVTMEPVPVQECLSAHDLGMGLPYPPFPQEAFCAHANADCEVTGTVSLPGGGLLVTVKDAEPMLVGVMSSGSLCSNFYEPPAVYTSIAPVREWILEQMGEGERKGIQLNFTSLDLASGAYIQVFDGSDVTDVTKPPLFMEGSSIACDKSVRPPVRTEDGALFVSVFVPACQGEACTATEVKLTWEMDGPKGVCEIGNFTWKDLLQELKPLGKALTGGMGKSRGLWVCVKDWDDDKRMQCRADRNEWVCFKYDLNTKLFTFMGFNTQVKIVSAEMNAQAQTLQNAKSMSAKFDEMN